MSVTLASEICADLKRSNRRKDIIVALVALALSIAGLLLALENNSPTKHIVATSAGR